jgi:PBP superfamily domain
MKHTLFTKLTKSLWIIFYISLTGCISSTGAPSARAPSTLLPLRVDVTPALGNYRPILNQCAQEQPDIALFVKETPASNMEKKESDLQLHLGLPNQGVEYAFQVGEESIQFVINSNQTARSIAADQIRALFAGEITDWSQASGDQGSVHPWVYPDGNELESIFDRVLMNGKHISSSASIAADPKGMQMAVAQDAGAIGFLPSSWLTDTIQAIGLDPKLALQLNIPVLALTESEPQGLLGVFIACLQKNGESVVASP